MAALFLFLVSTAALEVAIARMRTARLAAMAAILGLLAVQAGVARLVVTNAPEAESEIGWASAQAAHAYRRLVTASLLLSGALALIAACALWTLPSS